MPNFGADQMDSPLLSIILDYLKEVNGALLIVLGGVFRIWQTQLKMKREAAKELFEAKQREEAAKQKAEHMAMDVKREAERTAREERERLEKALERERSERHKEMQEKMHHLANKMQVYENELGIYKKQAELDARERQHMSDSIQTMEEKQREMRERLKARDTENHDLRAKAIELQQQVDLLQKEVETFRAREARVEELERLLFEANAELARYRAAP